MDANRSKRATHLVCDHFKTWRGSHSIWERRDGASPGQGADHQQRVGEASRHWCLTELLPSRQDHRPGACKANSKGDRCPTNVETGHDQPSVTGLAHGVTRKSFMGPIPGPVTDPDGTIRTVPDRSAEAAGVAPVAEGGRCLPPGSRCLEQRSAAGHRPNPASYSCVPVSTAGTRGQKPQSCSGSDCV
jgi:hypothetical protein